MVEGSALNAAIMLSSSARLAGGRLRRLGPKKTSVMCMSDFDIASRATGEAVWTRSMHVWRASFEAGSSARER